MPKITHYLANANQGAHCDESPRVSVVLSGSLSEESERQSVVAKALDLVVKSDRVPHQNRYGPQGATIWTFPITPDIASAVNFERDRPEAIWIQDRLGIKLALKLIDSTVGKDRLATEATVLDVVAHVAGRNRVDRCGHGRNLNRVRERIYERPAQTIDVRQTALDLGLHPVYLARAYRKQFGVSIQEDRQLRRIKLSSCMLTKSQASVTEIAHDLGFFDQSHFCRLFKQYTGKTPGAYRVLVQH